MPHPARQRAQAIVAKATAEGITPLEVMLKAMRAHYDEDRLDQAAAIAKEAAPYLHPRLSSVDAKVNGQLTLEALVAQSFKKG